jgi:CBS domain-containing protein
MKGGPYEYRIRGVEELVAKQNNPTFEFCNTSFQIHLQVAPSDFVNLYNLSRAISAPVLACACNSPLLLGKRLWKETRIALFQQAVDTRHVGHFLREQSPRVTFAQDWVKESMMNAFKDDIARFRVLLTTKVEEDSLEELEEGRIPQLKALRVFVSTVYRWNRACYGVYDAKPHLRIENRVLPSGPTVIDEMANAAFWFGLMKGMPDSYPDITKVLLFENVAANFAKAAQIGLDSQFRWIKDKVYPADELILKELLPIARYGLEKVNIPKKDVDKFLSVIEERTRTRKTGARWITDSFNKLNYDGTKQEALVALTAGIVRRQKKGIPVHRWSLAEIEEGGSWMKKYWHVEQLMSSDLFTVQKDDLVDLAAHIMDWKHIRHVPIEDERGNLVGLITSGLLLHHYTTCVGENCKAIPVEKIMVKNPITVTPETLIIDAIKLMRDKKIGCLPVLRERKLVGIITEHDFMKVSERLMREFSKKTKSEE